MKDYINYGIDDDVHEVISATEVVRNFSSAIDKVRYPGIIIYITKGSQTISELSPPPKSGFPTNQLGVLLNSLPGLGEDVELFSEDIQDIKDESAIPEDPWGS